MVAIDAAGPTVYRVSRYVFSHAWALCWGQLTGLAWYFVYEENEVAIIVSNLETTFEAIGSGLRSEEW